MDCNNQCEIPSLDLTFHVSKFKVIFNDDFLGEMELLLEQTP